MKKIYFLLCSLPAVLQAQSIYQSIDSYWSNPSKNNFREILTQTNGLNKPNDLDFNPMETNGPNELWVINEMLENTGGSTVTVLNAGKSNQTSIYKKDGNSWHFMALPTGMAFGDKGDWGSSNGIYDANRSGGTPFTGPSLWSGDLGIYAITPPGGNGSHLDMLHQSPYGMGIAHDHDNVYWVFDGFNSTLVRYDFAQDHGPGNSNHDDGKVHFYKEISLKRDNDGVPGHMVLDKENNQLYICDTGNDRILKVDITSGTKKSNLPFFQETLAERWEMQNVSSEVVVSSGLSKPCGIDIYGDRLVVTDNGTNEIIFYDISVNPVVELGRIGMPYTTPNIRGIKVGPMGKIWFVDYSKNKTYVIEHPSVFPLGINERQVAALKVWPNPANDVLRIAGLEDKDISSLKIFDSNGREVKVVLPSDVNSESMTIDVSDFQSGLYLVSVQTASGKTISSRFVRR